MPRRPYLRGVGLVHIPTTLLAQVDSSIGGKVGINHALGKNLIGSFHQPLAVFADPEVLGTLPRREFRAGLYEVVKYGMIADRGLFERVGARPARHRPARIRPALAPVIADSCRIKARVVAEDEREGGVRRILNFGHTAGHAIEAVTRYRRFRHGEAVAYGMLAVADLGVRRGVFAEAERSALADLVAPPRTAAVGQRPLGAGARRGDAARQEGPGRAPARRAADRYRRHPNRRRRHRRRVRPSRCAPSARAPEPGRQSSPSLHRTTLHDASLTRVGIAAGAGGVTAWRTSVA